MRDEHEHANGDDFGAYVRITRAVVGITQERLAIKAGIHAAYLSRIERGLRSASPEARERIERALSEAGR